MQTAKPLTRKCVSTRAKSSHHSRSTSHLGVGNNVGKSVGRHDGTFVGVVVGEREGASVGVCEGESEGLSVVGGFVVGISVGVKDGGCEGSSVGVCEGVCVGISNGQYLVP